MNIEKYTERARGFIQNAQQLALSKGHQQFAPLHLLKVLLDDEEGMAAGLIDKAGGNAQRVRGETEAALNKMPKVSGDGSQLYLSRELARVFDTAERPRRRPATAFVTVERLLLALAVEKDTMRARFSPRRRHAAEAQRGDQRDPQGPHRRQFGSAENSYDALKKYARDLTAGGARARSIRSSAATRKSAAPSRC
jgi:ATP-dependent Clp protease ATP-binding subunit ClpB